MHTSCPFHHVLLNFVPNTYKSWRSRIGSVSVFHSLPVCSVQILSSSLSSWLSSVYSFLPRRETNIHPHKTVITCNVIIFLHFSCFGLVHWKRINKWILKLMVHNNNNNNNNYYYYYYYYELHRYKRRTGCWGEYLDRREMKWREIAGNCITRSFITSTPRQT
jgi:hypothetical protein